MAKGSLEILKNKIDVSKVLEQLNAALSEEWLSFYQYWIGALVAEGAMRAEIQKELQKHAEAEYKHAKLVADRIIELEGVPVLNPKNGLNWHAVNTALPMISMFRKFYFKT